MKTTLNTLEQLWSLTAIHPFNNLSCNYVAKAYDQSMKRQVVLKIHKNFDSYTKEVIALRAYKGYGAVRLLRNSDEYKALLLEYLKPANTLAQLQGSLEEHTHIIAQLIAKLHTAELKEISLPYIEQNIKSLFLHNSSTINKKYLVRAQGVAKELLSMHIEPVLLHADLHYHNVLINQQEWVAVDPHGLIGDPAYEVGAYIRNFLTCPISDRQLFQIVHDKVRACAYYTAIDLHRLQAWSYVNTVLAACWMIEDKKDPSSFLSVADALQ